MNASHCLWQGKTPRSETTFAKGCLGNEDLSVLQGKTRASFRSNQTSYGCVQRGPLLPMWLLLPKMRTFPSTLKWHGQLFIRVCSPNIKGGRVSRCLFVLAQAGSQGKIERSWLLLGESSNDACVRLPRLHLSPPRRNSREGHFNKANVSDVPERRRLELQSRLCRGIH